eukprot:403371007
MNNNQVNSRGTSTSFLQQIMESDQKVQVIQYDERKRKTTQNVIKFNTQKLLSIINNGNPLNTSVTPSPMIFSDQNSPIHRDTLLPHQQSRPVKRTSIHSQLNSDINHIGSQQKQGQSQNQNKLIRPIVKNDIEAYAQNQYYQISQTLRESKKKIQQLQNEQHKFQRPQFDNEYNLDVLKKEVHVANNQIIKDYNSNVKGKQHSGEINNLSRYKSSSFNKAAQSSNVYSQGQTSKYSTVEFFHIPEDAHVIGKIKKKGNQTQRSIQLSSKNIDSIFNKQIEYQEEPVINFERLNVKESRKNLISESQDLTSKKIATEQNSLLTDTFFVLQSKNKKSNQQSHTQQYNHRFLSQNMSNERNSQPSAVLNTRNIERNIFPQPESYARSQFQTSRLGSYLDKLDGSQIQQTQKIYRSPFTQLASPESIKDKIQQRKVDNMTQQEEIQELMGSTLTAQEKLIQSFTYNNRLKQRYVKEKPNISLTEKSNQIFQIQLKEALNPIYQNNIQSKLDGFGQYQELSNYLQNYGSRNQSIVEKGNYIQMNFDKMKQSQNYKKLQNPFLSLTSKMNSLRTSRKDLTSKSRQTSSFSIGKQFVQVPSQVQYSLNEAIAYQTQKSRKSCNQDEQRIEPRLKQQLQRQQNLSEVKAILQKYDEEYQILEQNSQEHRIYENYSPQSTDKLIQATPKQKSKNKQESKPSSQVSAFRKSPSRQKIDNLQEIIENLEKLQSQALNQDEAFPQNLQEIEQSILENKYFNTFAAGHQKFINKAIDQAQEKTLIKFKEELNRQLDEQSPFRQAYQLQQKKQNLKQQKKRQDTQNIEEQTSIHNSRTQSIFPELINKNSSIYTSRQTDSKTQTQNQFIKNESQRYLQQSPVCDQQQLNLDSQQKRERMNSYSRWLLFANKTSLKQGHSMTSRLNDQQ